MRSRPLLWTLGIGCLLGFGAAGCFPDYGFAPGDSDSGTDGPTPEGMVRIDPPKGTWSLSLNAASGAAPIAGTVRFSHSFFVDRFEVTTGRYRAWLQEQGGGAPVCGNPPCALDPGGPYDQSMRWSPDWPTTFGDTFHLTAESGCSAPLLPPGSPTTWDLAKSDNRWELPMTCVNWFEAAAFCASEGKRLLTQAEWIAVATSGEANRAFPWGHLWPVDCAHAIHNVPGGQFCGFPVPVGSAPQGATNAGVHDLAGSVFEWVWDAPWVEPPNNVADFSGPPIVGSPSRVRHGGAFIVPEWDGDTRMQNQIFEEFPATDSYADAGFRCAKTVIP